MLMMSLIFFRFEKLLVYSLFLPSFIVVRHQMAELNWGLLSFHCRGVPDPVQNRVRDLKMIQKNGTDIWAESIKINKSVTSCDGHLARVDL